MTRSIACAIALSCWGLAGCDSSDSFVTAPDSDAASGSGGSDASSDVAPGNGGSAGTSAGGSGGSGGDRYAPLLAAIQDEFSKSGSTGAAVSVVEDGKVAWSHALGVKKAGSTEPVTTSTNFYMGGIGVMLTGLGAWRLVDTGALDVEAPVLTYLPELTVPEAKGGLFLPDIKVRHVLDSTAGLSWDVITPPAWKGSDDSVLLQYFTDPTGFAANERIVSPPGAIVHFSMRAPTVIAAIQERASSKYFRQFIRDEVLGPLEMTRTYFDREEMMTDGDLAYDASGAYNGIFHWALERPSGIGVTNVVDAAKLASFLLDGNSAFLSESSRQKLLSPSTPLPPLPDKASAQRTLFPGALTHGLPTLQDDGVTLYPYDVDTMSVIGGWGSTADMLFLVPSKKFALVVFVTNGSPMALLEQLQMTALEVLGYPPVAPLTKTESAAELQKYVGVYKVSALTAEVTLVGDKLHLEQGLNSCDLEASYPPNFYCPGASWSRDVLTFVPNNQQQVEYLLTQDWVATRVSDASDAGAD